MENFVVSVRDIAYLYSQDGSVIPFIRNFITGISLTLMDNDSDFDVVAGDVISVGIRGIKFVVKIIDRAPVDRTDIRIISCPVCHQPLTFRNGFSYCCNCDCRAQLEENIFATFIIEKFRAFRVICDEGNSDEIFIPPSTFQFVIFFF